MEASKGNWKGNWTPRHWIVPLLLVAGCAQTNQTSLPSAEGPEIPFCEELQRAVENALADAGKDSVLVISAAVFIPGYATWSGVAGSSNPGESVTPNTLFDVGSVAKNFEAALTLILAEEGALSLDSPVSNWLPPLQNVDPTITVRQLLNHTSGVFNVFENPDFPWIGADVDYGREWSMDEVFSNFVLEPYGAPGSVQHYSSTNYRLLTAVLEEATGHSVPELVEDRLLGPHGLNNTYMTMGAWPPRPFDVAHPMADVDQDGELDDLAGQPRSWVATLTHPVLFSTPLDLVRWIRAVYHDRTVLSATSLEAMLTYPHPLEADPDGNSYGMGVVDYTKIVGTQAIGHTGSALGYSAAALFLPESGAALAWAINTGESPADLAADLMRNTWDSLSAVILSELER